MCAYLRQHLRLDRLQTAAAASLGMKQDSRVVRAELNRSLEKTQSWQAKISQVKTAVNRFDEGSANVQEHWRHACPEGRKERPPVSCSFCIEKQFPTTHQQNGECRSISTTCTTHVREPPTFTSLPPCLLATGPAAPNGKARPPSSGARAEWNRSPDQPTDTYVSDEVIARPKMKFI